ncbi:MAG: hypothetical protein QY330_01840 [Candidatus Dojkabacteria bacterium]|uniref:PilN domain-containing protein n=2 Tax=Candidatus Dojkabacteria TaxID=74243 RepID=A0A952AG00_9BACT|nr:hypothetical protein [Candidatus Dojkabacteria bacterium]WKZ28329.1 MAG: hypothetical protein QY330_01840 [Candidatus Dojkabacteria bacterium]
MKSFTFNLLPKKTKEEVQKEEERDQSAIYTGILPLFAVCMWLALILFNGLVVDRVKANWQDAIDKKEKRIESEYSAILRQNGELVKKTQALESVVQLDINPDRLFQLKEEIFPFPEQGIVIDGYGRERDGTFNVTIRTPDLFTFSRVARRFTSNESIKDVYVSSVSMVVANQNPTLLDQAREISGRIRFNFVETDISQDL